jgi:hypothetical protein
MAAIGASRPLSLRAGNGSSRPFAVIAWGKAQSLCGVGSGAICHRHRSPYCYLPAFGGSAADCYTSIFENR